jgi:quercetin dioxygenase-like cupin family protein
MIKDARVHGFVALGGSMSDPEAGWFAIAPGIIRRTLVSGTYMMQMIVRLTPGSHLPEHRHPHEQLSHILSGRLRFFIDGTPQEVGPGESVCIPGGILHAADVLEEALVIDTFSPPREDLLAQDRSHAKATDQ